MESGRVGMPSTKPRSSVDTRTLELGNTPRLERISIDIFILQVQNPSSTRFPTSDEGVDSAKVKVLLISISHVFVTQNPRPTRALTHGELRWAYMHLSNNLGYTHCKNKASGRTFVISSLLANFLPALSILRDILTRKSAISLVQAILATIPATRRSSLFHTRTKRLLRSIDSRSTVGITDGVETCAFKPVAKMCSA